MDIVRIFENICTELDYKFHYGNKSHLNLIDQNGNLEPNKIHLLLLSKFLIHLQSFLNHLHPWNQLI